MKRRLIIYSYGHPGSMNPAVKTNKDAYMIYGHEQQYQVFILQAADFRKKTR